MRKAEQSIRSLGASNRGVVVDVSLNTGTALRQLRDFERRRTARVDVALNDGGILRSLGNLERARTAKIDVVLDDAGIVGALNGHFVAKGRKRTLRRSDNP